MNKIIKRIILSLVIGFIISLVIMTLFITHGYSRVYSYNLANYDVTIMGLKIYDISLVNGAYIGKSVDYGMGIVSGLCMILSAIAGLFIKRQK